MLQQSAESRKDFCVSGTLKRKNRVFGGRQLGEPGLVPRYYSQSCSTPLELSRSRRRIMRTRSVTGFMPSWWAISPVV
jgi:hypothetical protein